MTDDELFEIWSLPFTSVAGASEPSLLMEFTDCRLNCGKYQNIAHLHLKVGFVQKQFCKKYGDVVNILKGVESASDSETALKK